MKKLLCQMIVIFCVVTTFMSQAVYASEEKGFSSQLEVMEYFVEKMSESKLEEAMNAFPINKEANNYDFQKDLDRYMIWNPIDDAYFPTSSELFKSVHKLAYESNVLLDIRNFAKYIMIDSEYLEGYVLKPEELGEAGFLRDVDAAMATLELVRLDYVDPENQNSEEAQMHHRKTAEIHGADNFTYYMALYKMEDKFYMGGATFIQYGDEYYLWTLDCNYVSLYLEGKVTEVSELAYLIYTKSLVGY